MDMARLSIMAVICASVITILGMIYHVDMASHIGIIVGVAGCVGIIWWMLNSVAKNR